MVWICLRDSMFSRFGTIPACNRQTDGRTDRQTGTRRQHIPIILR